MKLDFDFEPLFSRSFMKLYDKDFIPELYVYDAFFW